jgi:hypothetical protein
VCFVDGLVLLAKEQTVMQHTIDRLTATEGQNEMEMNVEKTTVFRISRKPSPVEIMVGKTITRECEIFQLFV